jgi:hypothetical protein
MILSLALGLGIFVPTLCVQAVPTAILIRIATSKHPRSLTRPSFWPNFVLFQMAAVFLALAHLVDIALWALLHCLCGEFAEFEAAYYHSAVNFSSYRRGGSPWGTTARMVAELSVLTREGLRHIAPSHE